MSVVIFGANGFIGKNICYELSSESYEVTALDKDFDEKFFSSLKNINTKKIDFLNPETYDKYIHNNDIVIHLIYVGTPYMSNQNKIVDIKNNLIPSLNLFQLCASKKIKRLIFASSGGAIYGSSKTKIIDENHETNPINSYGVTRLATEKYLRIISEENNFDFAILRISNPYGRFLKPNSKVGIMNTIEQSLINDKEFELRTSLHTTRDYINVIDVARSFLYVINHKNKINETFNISSSKGTSIKELIKKYEKIYNKTLKIKTKINYNKEPLINILDNKKFLNFFKSNNL